MMESELELWTELQLSHSLHTPLARQSPLSLRTGLWSIHVWFCTDERLLAASHHKPIFTSLLPTG